MSILVLLLAFLPIASSSSSELIYKGCANQSFTISGPAASSPAIAALATALSAHSLHTNFFKTTTSYSGQTLSGLYQCRGDLATPDCSACVSSLLPMWSTLCGSAVAARIQLPSCYAFYQVSGFPQTSGTQLLFKTCASGSSGGSDFEVRRDTAFSNLQSGIAAAGTVGFYATNYQSVYALAQCEGDLSVADCSECVSQALQKAEVDCGGAISGQVYLDKCYITYNYYPNGVPRSGEGLGNGGQQQQTGKTVAIVVGGAAGLGFLVIFLLFTRSLFKKKEEF